MTTKQDNQLLSTLLKACVLISSDRSSSGVREDKSGPILKKLLEESKIEVITVKVVPDEKKKIKNSLCWMVDAVGCDLILTSGGTGIAPRDVTPEATQEILDKEVPGIAEAIRYESLQKTKHAMLSRLVSGIRRNTLIINMPGSPKACKEAWQTVEPIVRHAVDLLKGEVMECHTLSS